MAPEHTLNTKHLFSDNKNTESIKNLYLDSVLTKACVHAHYMINYYKTLKSVGCKFCWCHATV